MIRKIIAGGLRQSSSGIDVSITVEFFCVKSKIRHETMWFQRRVLHLIHFRTTSFCTINLSFRFMVLLCVRGSNFKLPIVQQLINSWSNKDVKNVLVQRTSVAWTTISFRWHCKRGTPIWGPIWLDIGPHIGKIGFHIGIHIGMRHSHRIHIGSVSDYWNIVSDFSTNDKMCPVPSVSYRKCVRLLNLYIRFFNEL